MKIFLSHSAGLLALPLFFAALHLTYGGWVPPAIPLISGNDSTLLKIHDALWLDAREDHLFQKEHVSGAVNLNRKNWDQRLPAFFENYGEGKTIIVYCSAGCHESHVIAARLRELGLEDVRIFEAGYEGWKRGNLKPPVPKAAGRVDTNGYK